MIYIWYVIYELHLSINTYMHTHTHLYIQIHDIHLIYDICITSDHQHTHDHTCPDSKHYPAACNSLSFNVYTDTHIQIHKHTCTLTCIHTDIWYTSDIWYINYIWPSTHTRPHLPWQKTLPTLLQLAIIQCIYIHIYRYTYIHIYMYTYRYMIYICPSTHTRPHLISQKLLPTHLQLTIIQCIYRYTYTDTHTYTHTCIQTDMWYTSDIWYMKIHVSIHTHTTPPALTGDTTYSSATLYYSMYIHTHTHTHTYTYTCIHTDTWHKSVHQNTHDHTCPDRSRCLAACNSQSFNVYTHTCTDTHTYTYTTPALTEAAA